MSINRSYFRKLKSTSSDQADYIRQLEQLVRDQDNAIRQQAAQLDHMSEVNHMYREIIRMGQQAGTINIVMRDDVNKSFSAVSVEAADQALTKALHDQDTYYLAASDLLGAVQQFDGMAALILKYGRGNGGQSVFADLKIDEYLSITYTAFGRVLSAQNLPMPEAVPGQIARRVEAAQAVINGKPEALDLLADVLAQYKGWANILKDRNAVKWGGPKPTATAAHKLIAERVLELRQDRPTWGDYERGRALVEELQAIPPDNQTPAQAVALDLLAWRYEGRQSKDQRQNTRKYINNLVAKHQDANGNGVAS